MSILSLRTTSAGVRLLFGQVWGFLNFRLGLALGDFAALQRFGYGQFGVGAGDAGFRLMLSRDGFRFLGMYKDARVRLGPISRLKLSTVEPRGLQRIVENAEALL